MFNRPSWLSLTPEPERELPAAVTTLRHGSRPPADQVAAERARIEQLVTRGNERRWLGYLRDVRVLIDQNAASDNPEIVAARARAAAVVANHHNLLLGLPGRAAQRTASERARLALTMVQLNVTPTSEDPV
jgi:hypothetical protein